MGVCAFCGYSGKLTREDAWPKWLVEFIFPPTQRVDTTWGRTDQEMAAHLKTVYNPRLKTMSLCQDCNNNWLSPFEKRSKKRLRAWIKALRGRVTHAEQGLLAFWAIKTAMTVDLAHPNRKRVIPASDRHALHANRTYPPDGVHIWAALRAHRYPGIGHQSRQLPFDYLNVSRLVPDRLHHTGYWVIFAIHFLEIHILGLGIRGLDPEEILPDYVRWLNSGRAFYRLWPPEGGEIPLLAV